MVFFHTPVAHYWSSSSWSRSMDWKGRDELVLVGIKPTLQLWRFVFLSWTHGPASGGRWHRITKPALQTPGSHWKSRSPAAPRWICHSCWVPREQHWAFFPSHPGSNFHNKISNLKTAHFRAVLKCSLPCLTSVGHSWKKGGEWEDGLRSSKWWAAVQKWEHWQFAYPQAGCL